MQFLRYRELEVTCSCGNEAWQDENTPRRKIDGFDFNADNESFTCTGCGAFGKATYHPHLPDAQLAREFALVDAVKRACPDTDKEKLIYALEMAGFDGGAEAEYFLERYENRKGV